MIKKLISFIIVITLVLNLFLPIISEANNIIDNNLFEQSVNDIENNEITNEIDKDNQIEDEIIDNNIIENEIVDDTDNIVKNEIVNDTNNSIVENEIANTLDEDVIEKEDNDISNDISNFDSKSNELSVKYISHVQDIGWQEYVTDGATSGTTGKNLKVEAIKISLVNSVSNISVKYAAYVQSIGWQKDASNGQMSGTTGKNLKMEAIKIWLEGTEDYSIMYRTHIQDYGWQDWKYDKAISGKINEGKKIEAIEIKIIPKIENQMNVLYSSHVQDIGWQEGVDSGEISGTTGKNLKVEAIKLELVNPIKGVSIRYKTYVENSGWQSWVKEGQISGTTGRNLKTYGIRIELIGTNEYSIQYRAHVQDDGWTGWKKDGDIAGNITQNKKIEAIQIKIVKEKNNNSGKIGVEYYTYLQGFTWNENKVECNGETSGTEGENRKMEGIEIELMNVPSNAHIKYKTHVQDIGWMDWVRDGQLSGVIEKNLKIEAIQIELEGLDNYTVEYKVHVQDIGWTDWYIDGEIAGTTGKNKKIEAIQIRIVPEYKRHYIGIDVSYWQKTINFDKLVASKKIDFMISRIGWYSESQTKLVVDPQFERNYKETRQRKIPLGAYFYSYAMSVDEAKEEAESVVNYLKSTGQTEYELPIFYDIEHNSQIALGKDTITQMSIAFCEIIKNAGFKVGVYSYSYWLDNYMNLSQLPNDYSIWVANYGKDNNGSLPDNIYKYADTHDIWQYTSTGKVDGIDGDVDMNICYRRYF